MPRAAIRSPSSAGSSPTRDIASVPKHPARLPEPDATARAAAIDAFCDQLWLQDGLARASLESYRRDLVRWGEWLAHRRRTLHDATRGDVEAFLAEEFS